jgi:hypothetical protein
METTTHERYPLNTSKFIEITQGTDIYQEKMLKLLLKKIASEDSRFYKEVRF